jgi:hypothetical protein
MVAPGERRGLQPENHEVLGATVCELQDGQCRVLADLVFFRVGPTTYHAAKAWRDLSSDFILIHKLRGTPESAASCQAVQKLLGHALVQVPKQSLAATAVARGSGNSSSSSALSNCTASYSRTIDTRLLQPLTAVRARNLLAQVATQTQVMIYRFTHEHDLRSVRSYGIVLSSFVYMRHASLACADSMWYHYSAVKILQSNRVLTTTTCKSTPLCTLVAGYSSSGD